MGHTICILFSSNQELETSSIGESFLRLTPEVAHRKGQALFLEISKCKKITTEERVLLKVRALLHRMKLHATISRGEDASTALAKAHAGLSIEQDRDWENRNQLLSAIPLRHLQYFLDPFEENIDKSRKVQKLITHLNQLGMDHLIEFAHLPAKALPSRFGSLGLELFRRVKWGHTAPWPRLPFKEEIREELALGEGTLFPATRELEPLLFLLRPMIEKTVTRLRGRGLRALSLELNLSLEKFSITKNTERLITLELPLPQGSTQSLFRILKERLGSEFQKHPLESAVQNIVFEIAQTAPGAFAQKDIFHKREEEQEKWNTLINRFEQRLGKNRTYIASPTNRYLPEKSWSQDQPIDLEEYKKMKSKEHVKNSKELPQRPTRLLRSPQQILKKKGEIECPSLKKRWNIRSIKGPERLLGEWWEQLFHRDYFQVVSTNGEKLWVYQDLSEQKQPRFFLHGFFD